MFGFFYNRTCRKITAAIGTLFDSIDYARYDRNLVEVERNQVPLTFASKQKFVEIVASARGKDRDGKANFSVKLPRMAFSTGFPTYDASRQTSTTRRISVPNQQDNPEQYKTQFNKVPFDMPFELIIAAENYEDLYQIIEQILPYFAAGKFTQRFDFIDDFDEAVDVDFIYESGSIEENADGDFEDTRLLIATMSFRARFWLYHKTVNSEPIRRVDVSLYDLDTTAQGTTGSFMETITTEVVPAGLTTGGFSGDLERQQEASPTAGYVISIDSPFEGVLGVTAS